MANGSERQEPRNDGGAAWQELIRFLNADISAIRKDVAKNALDIAVLRTRVLAFVLGAAFVIQALWSIVGKFAPSLIQALGNN